MSFFKERKFSRKHPLRDKHSFSSLFLNFSFLFFGGEGSHCRLWQARSKFATVSADLAHVALQMQSASLSLWCARHRQKKGASWDSTDICCPAQLAWNARGVLQVGSVRGWSPCIRGLVRGSRGGEPRRWWFAGGIWDGALKGTNSKHRSSEDEDPPARASWDCLSFADSSPEKQPYVTDIFPQFSPNFCIILFPRSSYLIDNVGTKNGFLHMLLIQLDDTFDVVDNLLDVRR